MRPTKHWGGSTDRLAPQTYLSAPPHRTNRAGASATRPGKGPCPHNSGRSYRPRPALRCGDGSRDAPRFTGLAGSRRAGMLMTRLRSGAGVISGFAAGLPSRAAFCRGLRRMRSLNRWRPLLQGDVANRPGTWQRAPSRGGRVVSHPTAPVVPVWRRCGVKMPTPPRGTSARRPLLAS